MGRHGRTSFCSDVTTEICWEKRNHTNELAIETSQKYHRSLHALSLKNEQNAWCLIGSLAQKYQLNQWFKHFFKFCVLNYFLLRIRSFRFCFPSHFVAFYESNHMLNYCSRAWKSHLRALGVKLVIISRIFWVTTVTASASQTKVIQHSLALLQSSKDGWNNLFIWSFCMCSKHREVNTFFIFWNIRKEDGFTLNIFQRIIHIQTISFDHIDTRVIVKHHTIILYFIYLQEKTPYALWLLI